MKDGCVHHTLRICQCKLNPLVQCGLHSFLSLVSAVVKHQCRKVSAKYSVVSKRCIKVPQHERLGRGVVFQQFIANRQFKLLQDGQRCSAQQRGEPTVKRSDLHLTFAVQRALVQT